MCIALPGKLIEIDESGFSGKIDFQGNIVNVMLGAVDAKVGDHVLVHAGSAIEVVDDVYAAEVMALFAELEEAYAEEDQGSREDGVYPVFKGDGQS